MPSPRRIRALLLAVIVSLGVTFYLTSGVRNNDGSSFYRQTMNAMSSKGHSEHSEQSPSVKNEQAILPNTGKEQDTFRKLQPSASEQDKQAIAPERQFEVEREQKKKDKEREAQKQREKAEEMEKKEKGNGKMEIGNDTANNGKGGDEDEDEDEGSEDVPVYKDKIDTAAKDKSGTDVESIDKSGKKEKSNESNNGDKGATKDGATKGSKVLTSTPGNDDKGADSEKKGKDGVKDLDGPADEAEEGSETKTTKSDEDPEIEAEFQAILKRSPVIVFSKTYCPFSKKAKHILGKYAIVPAPHIVELNEHPLGKKLQAMLGKITGRATVPNILVNGKSLGGGDDVEALHQKGELAQSIKDMAGKRVVQISSKSKRSTGADEVL